MKYLKTYENLEQEPQIGDWVVVRIDDNRRSDGDNDTPWTNMIEKSIGQVISTPDEDCDYDYNNVKDYFKAWKIKYEWKQRHFIIFKREIVFFDKDKEKVEAYTQTQKYNL